VWPYVLLLRSNPPVVVGPEGTEAHSKKRNFFVEKEGVFVLARAQNFRAKGCTAK